MVRAATAHRGQLGGINVTELIQNVIQRNRDMSGQYSVVIPSKQGGEYCTVMVLLIILVFIC